MNLANDLKKPIAKDDRDTIDRKLERANSDLARQEMTASQKLKRKNSLNADTTAEKEKEENADNGEKPRFKYVGKNTIYTIR